MVTDIHDRSHDPKGRYEAGSKPHGPNLQFNASEAAPHTLGTQEDLLGILENERVNAARKCDEITSAEYESEAYFKGLHDAYEDSIARVHDSGWVPLPPDDDILYEPMTLDQIKSGLSSDGFITGKILVDMDSVVGLDPESFYDLISERLVGSDLGMDITYQVVGANNGSVVVQASLDPSAVLDYEE
jgi:hypothetical protein